MGDTGRYPYGPRDLDEVRSFAVQIARWLVDEIDVKLIVVACNTASAAALDALRAAAAGPGGRGHRPRRAGAGPGHAQPAGGRGGDGGDHPVGRLPARHRGAARAARARARLVPGLRRVRRTGRDAVGPGGGAGRAAAGAGARRRGRRLVARVHALPVPGPDHRRRHGPRRGARVLGRRDRLRGARHPRRRRAGRRGRPVGVAGARTRRGTLRVFSSGDVEWFRTVGSRLFGEELGEVQGLSWPDPPRSRCADAGSAGAPSARCGHGRRRGAASG